MIDDLERERIGRNVAIWIIVNVLIIVFTPILHYIYLDRLLGYEYLRLNSNVALRQKLFSFAA